MTVIKATNTKHQKQKTVGTGLARFDSSWRQWSLRNGLRCLHVPLPTRDERFHVLVMVHTGCRDESFEKSGISHLLEHMMFRGSAKHPNFTALSEAFENLGGEWNAATGHEYTEYFYSGTVDKAEDAFDLLADFLLRPALQDLDTERRIVLRELEGELNEQGVSTDSDFHILRTIWPGTSMAMSIVGDEKSLSSIHQSDLNEWLAKHYQPQNMVICVVGGKASDARRLTKSHFHKFDRPRKKLEPKNRRTPSYEGPKVEVIENSDSEFDIQLTFVCEGTRSPKTAKYDMVSRLLADGFSSRLVRRIREELGLVYDISSDFHQYDGGGAFNINASVAETNIETFCAELFAVLDFLKSTPVTPSELVRHKTRALTDLQLVPTEPSHVAFRLSWSVLSGIDPRLETWREQMESIDAESIQEIAKELFQARNLAVVALGPTNKDITSRFQRSVEAWARKKS